MARVTKSVKRQIGFFGVALLIMLLATGALLFFFSGTLISSRLQRDEVTVAALAKAKKALIDYAIAGDDPRRPGEFPCPTQKAPGDSGYGDSPTLCAGSNLIGRLPWRKLGIEEQFDGTGEPLWYALSGNFNAITTLPTLATVINSDTQGDLRVFANLGATEIEKSAVAIVFSAGSVLPNQERFTAIRPCAATLTNRQANLCASNYLEVLGVANNALPSGPFTQSTSTASFNDKIAYIQTTEFIPQIEDRIAINLERTLRAYYGTNGYFPFAASYTDLTTRNIFTNANCSLNTFSGRVPQSIGPTTTCTTLGPWPSTSHDLLPAWLLSNNWNTNVYYAVGKQFAKGGTQRCENPGDCLTVGADPRVEALFILPGIPGGAQTRPNPTNVSSGLIIQNYFEDLENQQGWNVVDNLVYTQPTSRAPTRDKLVALKH
jgi:hypothetical protein